MTAVRSRLAGLVERQAAGAGGAVVVFALDGVGRGLADRAWRAAEVCTMRSVFPSTSAAAWLSSLTGVPVARHGIPGVVFTIDDDLVNVYEHHRPLVDGGQGNVFGDAVAHGYRAVAALCDLVNYPCSWRDLLLRGAEVVVGTPLYTRPGPYRAPSADELDTGLRAAVAAGLAGGDRCLLWCFVEVDTHIHHHGDDAHAVEALRVVERLALDLVADGHVVAAHSDHGHTPTTHDTWLAELLDGLAAEFGFTMGGAGRTRWLYPAPGTSEALAARLRAELPGSIRVERSDSEFPPGTAARDRVGDLLLVAEGTRFLTVDGYRFDHGSRTREEIEVPFAVWGVR
ncbi:alkaline phosphatase family protein [Actinokineospora globicatena]|uniref:alkaline phosphatase family protein n=1 Tax=Actinokineospora globicatena TaxID=103729 RepID=UPI0020A3C5DF|nr:alkaline phosphatase family protein [Actinokineospora globicatena]